MTTSGRLTKRSPSTSSFQYISTPYHGSTLSALQPTEFASHLSLKSITNAFHGKKGKDEKDGGRYDDDVLEEEDEDDKKKLDKDKVKKSVQEAIKAEAEYISKLSGGINVTGMGSKGRENDDDLAEAVDLTDAFKAMGLSESAAKIAANGR